VAACHPAIGISELMRLLVAALISYCQGSTAQAFE
jgi:hypothetical protein